MPTMLKGKKFGYAGRDERGKLVFAERGKVGEEGVIATLDGIRPGEPLRMGEKICKVRPDGAGSFDIDYVDLDGGVDDDGRGGGGPAMVSSDAYRSGWDAAFGRRDAN